MKKIEISNRFTMPASIREMLSVACEKYGDKIAYKSYSASNTLVEMTYKQVLSSYNSLGTAIASLDFFKEKICILSENRPEWMIAYMAIIGGGNTVIPLDKELLPNQIENFINYSEAAAIFCSEKYLPKVLEMNIPGVRLIACFDANECADVRVKEYSALLAKGEKLLAAGDIRFTKARYNTSKLSALIFTSGTTGVSKGVMLSEENILTSMTASANMINVPSDSVLISVLPMHHTYETCCGQLAALMLGVTICINNSLKYFMRNLKLFRPTTMVVVPLFVTTLRKKIQDEIKAKGKEKVVNIGVKATKALSKVGVDARKVVFGEITKALGGRLTNIICGGAPLDPECVDWFGDFGIKVSQGYGITECSPLVSVNPLITKNPASVGVPIPGSRVKIIDEDENGNEYDVEIGGIGEICVKGSHVMLGYYNAPEVTASAFTEEGFFRTGDYGYVDEDGLLYITGRKKNIIVLNNGKNVYPEEIEEYLYKNPLIKECVVVGRTKDSGEVVLTALIYPDFDKFNGAADEVIISRIKSEIAEINKGLASFKQIRNIELRKNEFEKTTTQKIIRYKLS